MRNPDTVPVTEDEERYVTENYRTMTSGQIAERLGCDTDRVDYIEKLLGLRKYGTWPPRNDALLAEYCQKGMRTSEMARLLGVCQKSVYNHMKQLGLSTTGSAPGRPNKNRQGGHTHAQKIKEQVP